MQKSNPTYMAWPKWKFNQIYLLKDAGTVFIDLMLRNTEAIFNIEDVIQATFTNQTPS